MQDRNEQEYTEKKCSGKKKTRLYSPQTKPLYTICMCTTLIGFLVQKLHCNVTGFASVVLRSRTTLDAV